MTGLPPPIRSRKLMALSVSQLVDLYEQLAIAQGDAYANFETAKSNRLFMRRRAVVSELRHREGDARKALLGLYEHRHPHVRASVARSTYALHPAEAMRILNEVAGTRFEPWASDARMSLSLLADGTSQLPNDPE